MRYTSSNPKLPKGVHDLVKAILAQNPQSPYEAVLKAVGQSPDKAPNPIENIVRERGLSEIEMALALDCTTHEAAALRVIGHALSKRETLMIVGILRDEAAVTMKTLRQRACWWERSYLGEALRIVFEKRTLPGYARSGNCTWKRVTKVA